MKSKQFTIVNNYVVDRYFRFRHRLNFDKNRYNHLAMPAKSMFARRVFRQTSATPFANTCEKLTLRQTHVTTALMEPFSLLMSLVLHMAVVPWYYNIQPHNCRV